MEHNPEGTKGVINYGTPMYTEDLALLMTLSSALSKGMNPRGNYQDSVGVSCMNVTGVCPYTGITIPKFNEKTDKFRQRFAGLTTRFSKLPKMVLSSRRSSKLETKSYRIVCATSLGFL